MNTHNNNPPKEFGNEILKALAVFQLIEESLKVYIEFSFKLIRIKLNKSIPFKFEGSDYSSSSLERLIVIFSKLSNNHNLIKKMNLLKDKRNYCAHVSIVEYLKDTVDNDDNHGANMSKLKEILKDAWGVEKELRGELMVLNNHIMSL